MNLHHVIYRTGGTTNAEWCATLAYPSLGEAITSCAAERRAGREAYITPAAQTDAQLARMRALPPFDMLTLDGLPDDQRWRLEGRLLGV